MEKTKLVDYDLSFLKLSWKWLNDPEIKQLTHTPHFTLEDQRKWFESLPGRRDYRIWGITYHEKKIGAVGLKKIANQSAEYFVQIGEKEYWGKGLGQIILDLTIAKAIQSGLLNIYLTVIKDNLRAIKSYTKAGFEKINEKGDQWIMNLNISNKLS